MQVILVIETRASCKSDYRYVKSTIDYFYGERSYKISKIFAKTKSELIKQDFKIISYISRYEGKSVVLICADYDRDSDSLNNDIEKYCLTKQYELVWMNRDVEDVFWGHQVDDKNKDRESFKFLTQKNKLLSSINTLNIEEPLKKYPSSNLLVVLDKYMKRKT